MWWSSGWLCAAESWEGAIPGPAASPQAETATNAPYAAFPPEAPQGDLVTPQVVESAMVNNSLLFLGFRLTDWAFRALFRMILKLEGKKRLMQHAHVAVQVDPDLHSMADVEGARKYLADYFKFEAKVDIFWGTPREFLRQLKEEVARQRPVEVVAPVEDGWDCGD